jgi:hypothetical protein
MDQLLCLRDRNPSVFYSRTRKILLSNIRATIILKNNIPAIPEQINVQDKKFVRPDIAKLTRYAQLFQIADRIDFTRTKYESHSWEERTKLGRSKSDSYKWEWKDFNKFSDEKIKKETW